MTKHRLVGGDVVAPERAWSPNQVRRFVLDARNRNEHAWHLIPALRDALIAREYASVVVGQMSGTVSLIELRNLWKDMNAEMEKMANE